jgi:hypothetical protein
MTLRSWAARYAPLSRPSSGQRTFRRLRPEAPHPLARLGAGFVGRLLDTGGAAEIGAILLGHQHNPPIVVIGPVLFEAFQPVASLVPPRWGSASLLSKTLSPNALTSFLA